ncbi:MAG: dTDP-4-amino-4,6-dideoxygalactose transaminase [Candidatus Melainabacteria bacterium]
MTEVTTAASTRTQTDHLPFNRAVMTGNELRYIEEALANGHLAADGPFTQRCEAWLKANTNTRQAILTHSCTAALEMAALLANIQPGDEVIMPSFTFVSTATAFVRCGGVPVFAEVTDDTATLDPAAVAAALTPKTRAIAPVHYAGVACAMAELESVVAAAPGPRPMIIADCAQGLMAAFGGKPLAGFGDLATLSFHETKNVTAGEGGALLINNPSLTERAEIIARKGTDRARFYRGEVDKYTWQDVGSSMMPSELNAAFLWAQLECAEAITRHRLSLWHAYHSGLQDLEQRGRLRRPVIPEGTQQNAHVYAIRLHAGETRDALMAHLNSQGINAVFHYVPLHSAPAGLKFGRVGNASGQLPVTDAISATLLRLPLWQGMTTGDCHRVVEAIAAFLK